MMENFVFLSYTVIFSIDLLKYYAESPSVKYHVFNDFFFMKYPYLPFF